MKEIAAYLLPFQLYAKLLISKIHPDIHHGYPNIQKINASVTSIINELFKFKLDHSEERYQIHNLHFFTWKPDKKEHQELFYKLLFNNPFDLSSGKSSLNLFRTAQIPVNFSVLDCLTDQNQNIEKISKLNEHRSRNIYEGIKQSCFDLDRVISEFEIREILDFFRTRPYIQFKHNLSNDLSKILRICVFLLHIIQGFEARMGSKMPLIIISNTYTSSEFIKGIVHLSLSSSFQGNFIYFKVIIYLYCLLIFRYY